MKHQLLIVVLSFVVPLISRAQATLVVNVHDIRNSNGVVTVALFTTAQDFLKVAAISKEVMAQDPGVAVTFERIPDGVYAVSVFHDKNRNGKLDASAIGIPTEGFGFGNDAMGLFGPPSFRKASITVRGRTEIVIDLKHL